MEGSNDRWDNIKVGLYLPLLLKVSYHHDHQSHLKDIEIWISLNDSID